MDKIKFYVFGEVGQYDKYNPYKVLSKENAPEVVYLIAKNEPFSLNKNDISNKLNIDLKEISSIIDSLELINAIYIKDNTYKLNFSVFLETDIEILDLNLNDVGNEICNTIVKLKEIIISKLDTYEDIDYKRVLYHIICDNIFDGKAMEYFASKNIFSISKKQPGNRDYIIVAYENSKKLETYSNDLLCSSNNYRTKDFTFNSFGDCNGNRKDVYRFFRQVNEANNDITEFNDLNNSYNIINDYTNRTTMNDCGNLVVKILEGYKDYNYYDEYQRRLLQFLESINYINIDDEYKISVQVPVFYKEHMDVVNDIADIILPNIENIVETFICDISKNSIKTTSIKHGVDTKEIANELWHQIFGITNEYLVKCGFVKEPYSNDIEGRYLQSLYKNN